LIKIKISNSLALLILLFGCQKVISKNIPKEGHNTSTKIPTKFFFTVPKTISSIKIVKNTKTIEDTKPVKETKSTKIQNQQKILNP